MIVPSATVTLQPSETTETIIYNVRYYPNNDSSSANETRFLYVPFYIGALNYKHELTISTANSKYISNPHLLNNKKYHLRLYLVVTGVLPLKVYMHNRGQVMRALTNYSYKLNEVSRRTSMLTNTHANLNQAGYNPNVSFDSEEGSHWSLNLLNQYINKRNGNWNKIWEEIKDICFKTFLIN